MFPQLIKRSVALLVLALIIFFSASGANFRNEVVKPFQEITSSVAVLTAVDEEAGLGLGGEYKPPKTSFVDYTALIQLDGLLSVYMPVLVRASALEPFQFIPEVYLDIFVPPQNVA